MGWGGAGSWQFILSEVKSRPGLACWVFAGYEVTQTHYAIFLFKESKSSIIWPFKSSYGQKSDYKNVALFLHLSASSSVCSLANICPFYSLMLMGTRYANQRRLAP